MAANIVSSFSQVEYCDNRIFHRRAAVDELEQRPLHMNRTIGQPKEITMIFGRQITKEYKGKLQIVIEDLDLPTPVNRSHYGHGFLKQYVRDDRLLRTEPATNHVYDYQVNYHDGSKTSWRPSWTAVNSGS